MIWLQIWGTVESIVIAGIGRRHPERIRWRTTSTSAFPIT